MADGQATDTATHQVPAGRRSWRLPADYQPKGSAGLDYMWRVQVRRGGQDKPGEATSPASATRRFTWR